MTRAYTHSTVFDTLKNTKETIQGNYTSLQYLQTLDFFLWEAVKPIAAECPSLFYNYFAKIVARQALKPSSKFTSNERAKLPLQFFNALVESDSEQAFEHIKEMHVNRGLLFGLVSFFLNSLRNYARIETHPRIPEVLRTSLIHQIGLQLGLRENGLLYPAMQQVEYWDEKARAWKSSIVEKYTRMTLLQAQRTYTDFNHEVDLDDVVQIYMVTMSKSIDRCDSRQGVLTTFIQNWFKSARGEVASLAGEEHDASIDALVEEHGDAVADMLGATLPDLSSELQQQIAYTSYITDPVGLVRTSLGIPQYVSLQDRKLLEALAYEG